MTDIHLHPEGLFYGKLISFGEIKRSSIGAYYFMMKLATDEGELFAPVNGIPNTLIIIYRAFHLLQGVEWAVKVKHRTHSGATYVSAEAWPSRDEEGQAHD